MNIHRKGSTQIMRKHPPRHEKRRHLLFYLRVYEVGSQDVLGYLVDVSDDGLMLMSDREIETDCEYSLRVHLLDPVDGQQDLHLDARCLWCKRSVNRDIYDAGFHIEKIDPKVLSTIQEVIERLGFQD